MWFSAGVPNVEPEKIKLLWRVIGLARQRNVQEYFSGANGAGAGGRNRNLRDNEPKKKVIKLPLQLTSPLDRQHETA
jgi:hypothetical protein